MNHTLGALVDREATRRGWGDQRLAFEVGVLPSQKVFNATQVNRLRHGKRQNLSRELVARLIEVLDLDPAEAWAAAGITPPGFNADHLRQLGFFSSRAEVGASSVQGDPKNGMYSGFPARRRRSDRRQRDRRHLRLVPAA